MTIPVSIHCNSCGADYPHEAPASINVAENPELKEAVMNGSVFLSRCPHCGKANLVKTQMLYHDPSSQLLICLSDKEIGFADGLEGYTCRLVSEVGDLIEKVKIFDAGLDDVVMELCKYITRMEMNKDVALKFVRMGNDGEMIMTYPEKGEMQMLSVGANVYADCSGIIGRNEALRSSIHGLMKIDADWIAKFIR